jgi:hypothetical protein
LLVSPLLDDDNAAFIQTGISIIAASRDDALMPSIARASGCRVSRDCSAVAIFLPESQATQLVADVRASGRIAVVFSRPTTHRTLQLKADDARVRAATPGEAAIVADYVDAFAREIGLMGHTAEQAGAMFQYRADDLVAIDFTPSAAFEQTPGPKAGTPLRPAR